MKLLTSSANSIGARITIELVVSSALRVSNGPAEAALICRSTDATSGETPSGISTVRRPPPERSCV